MLFSSNIRPDPMLLQIGNRFYKGHFLYLFCTCLISLRVTTSIELVSLTIFV